MAISGGARGTRVACETVCPKHAAPNLPAETRPRTRVFQEPANHRQDEFPGMERIARNTQAVCGFKYLASKRTPFFQMVKVIAAILRASVRRAISGLIPLFTSAS
jgi:hypothetical protein